MSDRYGAEIYLTREDLLHGGAHKITNVFGQRLLAKRSGRDRLIAETGAGQHGVATAMAGALFDLETEIHVGETDVERQAMNVFRMRLLDAEVNEATRGNEGLADAVDAALEDLAATVDHTHYLVGSVVGPDPFPRMVRDFQRVIGEEAREQFQSRLGELPDAAVARVGGGSNTSDSSTRSATTYGRREGRLPQHIRTLRFLRTTSTSTAPKAAGRARSRRNTPHRSLREGTRSSTG